MIFMLQGSPHAYTPFPGIETIYFALFCPELLAFLDQVFNDGAEHSNPARTLDFTGMINREIRAVGVLY
jgi:hypothetical protein